ncbi:MAG: panC, partial [Belnapia sp.]|nr:panC [Belnapia sp.]
MKVLRDLPSLRAALAGLGPLALVPTMGALHEGHLSLIAAARAAAPAVAVSIFVNPLQFGPNEDLSRYPRQEAADLAMLEASGCDLAWLPSVPVMYPPGRASSIAVEGAAEGWEGTARPGHFSGVATVCTKLFHQTGAVAAMFGEKDWQQLQVIRQVVRDLDMPIRIIGCPTVREADGLAMSSRNRFLGAEERSRAVALPGAMRAAIAAMAQGTAPASAL